ncbi:hypothetical protein OHB49_35715 [Streptomyces sp. NBC_01717]|uniref:hypothetical protein n=1 Tax=Streptomyces sp. NBC_01717 TaxID=2975918 RepID=UPI002E341A0E|nr:hypothetical protein [Streptomyces sp. NBC_01717]
MGDPETILPADASAPGDQPADSGTWSVTVEDLASDHNLPDKPAVRDGRIYLSAMRGLRAELKEIQNREPPGTSTSARDPDRELLWPHFHSRREHAIRAHIMDDIGAHAIVEDAQRGFPRESGDLTVDLAEVWLEDTLLPRTSAPLGDIGFQGDAACSHGLVRAISRRVHGGLGMGRADRQRGR